MELIVTVLFFTNFIVVIVGLSLLISRVQLWYVRKNGRITPAKITRISDTGITIGAGTSTGHIAGKRRWIQIELKIQGSPPSWFAKPPAATVKLHPNDLAALTPGLLINIYYNAHFPRLAVVADWGERQAVMPEP